MIGARRRCARRSNPATRGGARGRAGADRDRAHDEPARQRRRAHARHVGGPALAPLHGKIRGRRRASRSRRSSTSVWADAASSPRSTASPRGTVALARRRTQRRAARSPLPPGELPTEGTLDTATASPTSTPRSRPRLPDGRPGAASTCCAPSRRPRRCAARAPRTPSSTRSAASRNLIYTARRGPRTLAPGPPRPARPGAAAAVAARDRRRPQAIEALLHHHIVRLRVSAGGRLLVDVGGPYVLAPVRRRCACGGRDDRQLRALDPGRRGLHAPDPAARRADVLMYMPGHATRLVKNSLGPRPGTVPPAAPTRYRGKRFRVFTSTPRRSRRAR